MLRSAGMRSNRGRVTPAGCGRTTNRGPVRRSTLLLLVVLGGIVLATILLFPRFRAPVLTERVTAEQLHAAVQREADTTFVISGYLEVVATVRSQDTRVLLPDLLNLPLGTTRATVRVPGRVSYGFNLASLSPQMIRVRGDTVEVDVPEVTIFSTEPDLARLEVETTTGWARRPVTAQEAERRAVQLLTSALERQGAAHLASSSQSRVNTGRAVQALVGRTAAGLGMQRPVVRVRLGDGIILE